MIKLWSVLRMGVKYKLAIRAFGLNFFLNCSASCLEAITHIIAAREPASFLNFSFKSIRDVSCRVSIFIIIIFKLMLMHTDSSDESFIA